MEDVHIPCLCIRRGRHISVTFSNVSVPFKIILRRVLCVCVKNLCQRVCVWERASKCVRVCVRERSCGGESVCEIVCEIMCEIVGEIV